MPKANQKQDVSPAKKNDTKPYATGISHPKPAEAISNIINKIDRNSKQLNRTQKARIEQMANQAIEKYHSREPKFTQQSSGSITSQLDKLGIHASYNNTEPSTVPKSPTSPGCELFRQDSVSSIDYDSSEDQASACELSFDSPGMK